MASLSSQQNLVNTLPRELPVEFLKEITADFDPERVIGDSVFGTIYQGVLADGEVIAVKRLAENAVVEGKRFDYEVTNLMALKHENIVELVSFSHELRKKMTVQNGRFVLADETESCLCYKYPAKGNLGNNIYDAGDGSIDWDTRFKIIKGICQGLHFLHKELDAPLIHMNLVPSSIWLDDNWVPKIVDVGLSRLFGQGQTRMHTVNAKGKEGYIAPECLYRGEISTMSDIYSLGMIIIGITTGQNCCDSEDRSSWQFVDNVHRNWKTDEQIKYKYPSLDSKGLQQVKACILLGLKCVEADQNKRPSIVHIVNKLNGKRVPIFDQNMELNTLECILAGTKEPSHLELSLLQSITGNFSETKRIGYGGCGDVYKIYNKETFKMELLL